MKKKNAKDAENEKTIERDDGKGFERFEEFARKIVAVPKGELKRDKRKVTA